MEYSVQGDVAEITQHLTGISQKQVPFATALALTRTAKFVQAKIREEMPRVFDRPTRYTLNSTFVEPARKGKLWAQVKIKDDPTGAGTLPINYLAPGIYGGSRKRKGFERRLISAGKMPPNRYAVPASGADLDAYGNIKPSLLVQILSDLQAQFDPTQNTTARSKQRRLRSRTRRATFFFSTWPPSQKTSHLAPGIYRRTHLGFGTAIKPVLIFVSRNRYRSRLKFFQIADQVARSRFKVEFAMAMRQALATAR